MARLRLAAWALTGLLWFLWLGYEDRNPLAVVILSALASLILGLEGWRGRLGQVYLARLALPLRVMLSGALSGALVPVIGAMLMLVKISLHQHPQPDFSRAELVGFLARMPVWAGAGGLAGLGLGLLAWSRQSERRSR